MRTRFEKVHGLGNDFVLLDARGGGELVTPEIARQLCDRRTGIGADGILTLLPPRVAGADARLHIYNSDGSEAEMCGNGLRCAAKRLLAEKRAPSVTLETPAGVRRCEPGGGETIRVEMGRATVGAAIELSVLGEKIRGLPVSVGNPHFVILGEAGSEERARRLGPAIEQHSQFAPGRTNVEFCVAGAKGLTLWVWERGSGLTRACGTGACAAAAAAVQSGLAEVGSEIAVDLPGGRLFVNVSRDVGSIQLRGPAERVFVGELQGFS